MTKRAWGYWTKGKLDILRRYLDAFTTATKLKASERIYIDAFAGIPGNRDRIRLDNEFMGLTSLFGDDDHSLWSPAQPGERFYDHSPPSKPWFLEPDLEQGR